MKRTIRTLVLLIIFLLPSLTTYAAPSPNSLDTLKQKLNQAGLKRVSEKIVSFAHNSIHLTTQKINEDKLKIGESKIGGRPDVPEDFHWPVWRSKSLSFIAQINLQEVTKYDLEKTLPTTGMLYFFYDANQETWGFDPKDRGSWKVLFYNGPQKSLKRWDFPKDIPKESRYQACKLSFKTVLSLPGWESLYIEELKLSQKESDAYCDFLTEDEGYIHKLLGHPDAIQNEMQLECQLVSNGLNCGDSKGYQDPRRKELEKTAKNWRLLLQIDTDDNAGMMWGDVGRLYFWIKAEDLLKRDFAHTWMILQCY